MNLSELLKKRLIEKFESDPTIIKNEIEISKRDLKSAKKMLEISEWEWAHNAAYNSMLQASRALMFAKGYRPLSQEHHVAVIAFMKAVYQNKFGEITIHALDKARKQRNESIYDRTNSVSENQSKNLVSKAEFFVTKTLEIL
ncbi:MAG: HEPN domain-containing protein [Nitrososphaeraceae archaeon]